MVRVSRDLGNRPLCTEKNPPAVEYLLTEFQRAQQARSRTKQFSRLELLEESSTREIFRARFPFI